MNKPVIQRMRWLRSRAGQTLFEYAVIVAIVSIAAVLLLRAIGKRPPEMMEPVNDELAN